mmetsp:Transcript_7241/g.6357  ORF Transcript_7241/g.6357 Transcript_7241/m.6357 type:complete len:124 (-) Transcript_7241:1917-2288(-)
MEVRIQMLSFILIGVDSQLIMVETIVLPLLGRPNVQELHESIQLHLIEPVLQLLSMQKVSFLSWSDIVLIFRHSFESRIRLLFTILFLTLFSIAFFIPAFASIFIAIFLLFFVSFGFSSRSFN